MDAGHTALPEETNIYGFLRRPSLVDFPGHIAAVFFTSGCNFSCGYCHNAPMMGSREAGLSALEVDAAVRRFREHDWINGVTVTGGEPTLVPHLPDMVRWFRSQGLRVKLDTNGSNPEMLKEMLPYLDYIAMDVKCALESYPEFVLYSNTDAIRRSIDLLVAWDGTAEFRTTVIDSFHTETQMRAIGELIRGAKRYALQPFVPRDNLPDPAMRSMPRTSPDLLQRYAELMRPFAHEVVLRGRQ